MAQVIKTTFQLRRGNLEVWERNNPILAKGEPSFVVDKNALKIGDGVTPWKELEYIGVGKEDLAKAIEDYFKENPDIDTGADGRGIVSIVRTDGDGTAGTVDTYTITYTDLTTSTFTVYNGKDGDPGNGIAFIEYETTSVPGASIPLKFILDNGDTYNITIPGGKQGLDGRGIQSISRTDGNGAPGAADTYTIVYTDETTSTFTVTNGKDGEDGEDGASFWIATFPIDWPINQLAECEISGIQIPVSRELKEYDLILGADGNVGIVRWVREGKVGIRRSQVLLKGQSGQDGRGITSILRTSGDGVPGTRDTYTIYYTDDTTSTFDVINGHAGPMGPAGRGISFISLVGSSGSPSTSGVMDIYKIQYTDGTFDSFTVYNGKDGKDGSNAESEQREPQVFQTTSFDLLPTTDVYIGDFGIVKTQIVDDKNSHTAFIYTENGWAALDGNYNANNVYFDEDLLVTTKIGTIQTLTNGQATLSAKGKTLKQVFSSLIAERKAPTATLPSGTIEWTNYENGNYLVEVGETITPTWKTTFSAGSYSYGPATGVTSIQAKVYLSTNSNSSSTISAGEMNGKTGSLSALTVQDSTTKHYAKVDYGWAQGTSVPKDNFGDDYTNTSKNLPIQAASNKTDTSTYYIQGYRKAFFGSRVSPIELNSYNIRSLADNANSSNANFTVTIDQGATQVIIAVPQGRVVKKIEDNGAFGQDILEAFDKYTDSSTINVGGADATSSNIGSYSTKYNVYVYNPSTPLGSNTYTVILGNE